MKLKSLMITLALALMLLLCACAAADSTAAVNCYWQLEEVRVETTASDRAGDIVATTDALPVSGLSAAQMVERMRGTHTLSLGLTRVSNGSRAEAEYTVSSAPALIPGAACARLSLSAATDCEDNSYYLYATVNAGGRQIVRVRGNGAWVVRAFFPRQAVPGATRTLSMTAREINGLASVRILCVYRAMLGAMLIDTNGDIVLYDLDGNEIDRIGQSVSDMLPVFAQHSSAADGDTIFSAEGQEDGSLIVRLAPDSGLTTQELIRLIRAAAKSAQETDATSAATAVSSLEGDAGAATLYLAPGTELSDEMIAALIAAAQGKSIDATAMQDDVQAGEVALQAENTPSPTPISYADLKALIAEARDGAQEDTDDAASLYAREDGEGAQAVVLYGEGGVEALVITPGAGVTGAQLLEIIDRLERAGRLSHSYEETFGHDASALGLTGSQEETMLVDPAAETESGAAAGDGAAVAATGMEGRTWLSIQPGNVETLIG